MLNNQDFAEKRRKSLGGSDIGAILGLSKFRSPTDVWLEKTGRDGSVRDTLPLRFGQFAETFIADEYAQATQTQVVVPTDTYCHHDYPFMTGHIDRLVITPQGTSHILECKTANPFAQSEWGEVGSDAVPMSYLVQCLWYLMLTNLPKADLAVLFGNTDFRIYCIERDADIETMLLQAALDFWVNHVEKDQPPSKRNEADVKKLFTQVCDGKSIEASQQLYQDIQALKRLETHLDEAEAQISAIKTKIMSTLEDASTLTYQGHTIATWKAPKPSWRLDSKRLTMDHPALVAQYQFPIQNSRRLIIKELA